MWTSECAVETTAAPEAVWRQWADVAHWPEWNDDVERIELHGPFAAGSTIVMTPRGREPVELRIAEAVAPERFVDEASLDGVVVRTTHRAERLDGGGTRVAYEIRVSGPGADAIGPAIAADFPDVLAALVERAEG